jgi:hypothetical protein
MCAADVRSEDSIRAELDALAAAPSPEFAVPADASGRVADVAVLVFITLTYCPPSTVTRWSSAAPVSERSLALWRGFCRCVRACVDYALFSYALWPDACAALARAA